MRREWNETIDKTELDLAQQGCLNGNGITIKEIGMNTTLKCSKERTHEFRNYKTSSEGKKKIVSAKLLLEKLLSHTGGWPKSVCGNLIVQDAKGKFRMLSDNNSLFAWLHGIFDVEWIQSPGISKVEFYKFALESCEKFDSYSELPHYPEIPGMLYASTDYPHKGGAALDDFLDFFNPASDLDASLIKAFALTLFWGGAPGQRPAFLITTEDKGPKGGVGYGKTTLVEQMANLCGGYISYSPSEPIENLHKRILSPAGGKMGQRVIRLDNLKTFRLSNAGLEELITTDNISGQRMYVGDAAVPNYFTVCLTINGANLSRDSASRCVVIHLAKATEDVTWLNRLKAFVTKYRRAIIGDILLLLRSKGTPLSGSGSTRWGSWETGVLSKVELPLECRDQIIQRQNAINDDAIESRNFIETIKEATGHYVGQTKSAQIKAITTDLMSEIYHKFFGKKVGFNVLGKVIEKMGIPSLHFHRIKGRQGHFYLRLDGKPFNQNDIKKATKRKPIKARLSPRK